MITVKLNRTEQAIILARLNYCPDKDSEIKAVQKLYDKLFDAKPDNEHAALLAVAEAAKLWQKGEAGFGIKLDESLANLAAVRPGKDGAK